MSMAGDTMMQERAAPPALREKRALPPGRADGAGGPAQEPGRLSPRTAEEAREELARTRERMSHTLDRIEHRLVAKKLELRQRLSPRDRFREAFDEHPIPVLAVAFVVGFWLGGKLR